MSKILIIRADVNPQIGTGHILRCLALAQSWQEIGGDPVFIMYGNSSTKLVESRLMLEGIRIVHLQGNPGSIEDAIQTVNIAKNLNSRWIVVDGYHFGSIYQKIIKDNNFQLIFIDDFGHTNHYYADIVLNQDLIADEMLYRNKEPYTRLLLGTKYVLLRQEFRRWIGWKRPITHTAKKLLITLGGSDSGNVTHKVVDALNRIDFKGLEVTVVIGPANSNYEIIKDSTKNSEISLRFEANSTRMANLMADSDIAVSGGGFTLWELAFMGLPSLILILAENQIRLTEYLNDLHTVINLGWHQKISSDEIAQRLLRLQQSFELRSKMAHSSQKLVDGKGASRVVDLMI